MGGTSSIPHGKPQGGQGDWEHYPLTGISVTASSSRRGSPSQESSSGGPPSLRGHTPLPMEAPATTHRVDSRSTSPCRRETPCSEVPPRRNLLDWLQLTPGEVTRLPRHTINPHQDHHLLSWEGATLLVADLDTGEGAVVCLEE